MSQQYYPRKKYWYENKGFYWRCELQLLNENQNKIEVWEFLSAPPPPSEEHKLDINVFDAIKTMVAANTLR